jgi:hypothetical protein
MLGFSSQGKHFELPTPAYPTFREAVLAAVTYHSTAGGKKHDGWVTFEASPGGRGKWDMVFLRYVACAELAGTELNAGFDVRPLLRSAGLTMLADACVPRGKGCWRVPGATPDELAGVICIILEKEHGLGPHVPFVATQQF